jgi:hypothetical protein
MTVSVSNVSTEPREHKHAAPVPAEAPASPVTVHDDKTATVKDRTGRVIRIKKLSAYDRYRLFRALGPAQSENPRMVQYASLAASVAEIAGDPVAFPTTSDQVDVIIKRLDDAGLDAVMLALVALLPPSDEEAAERVKN